MDADCAARRRLPAYWCNGFAVILQIPNRFETTNRLFFFKSFFPKLKIHFYIIDVPVEPIMSPKNNKKSLGKPVLLNDYLIIKLIKFM